MTDEKYMFVTDVRDKKRTARGANAKVRGTGRRVNFPSDYMSEKERNAMNSDVKSFDLGQPMKWAEFCEMPYDLRREYILRLQKLYGAGDVAMGEMMGVSKASVFLQRKSLGIESVGRGKKPLPEWDNFVKYGTPREATPLGDLIPPEVKAFLDEWEKEHPPAVIAPQSSTEAEPTDRLSAKTYGALSYVQGYLAALASLHASDANDVYYEGVLHKLGEILNTVEVYT